MTTGTGNSLPTAARSVLPSARSPLESTSMVECKRSLDERNRAAQGSDQYRLNPS
jgi:hypothetical protein